MSYSTGAQLCLRVIVMILLTQSLLKDFNEFVKDPRLKKVLQKNIFRKKFYKPVESVGLFPLHLTQRH